MWFMKPIGHQGHVCSRLPRLCVLHSQQRLWVKRVFDGQSSRGPRCCHLSCCTAFAHDSALFEDLERAYSLEDDTEVHRLIRENSRRMQIPVVDEHHWAAGSWQQPNCTGPRCNFPVYVMLPLDTITVLKQGDQTKAVINKEQAFEVGLRMLREAGVQGVMVDVWWGIVERDGPQQYDFEIYRRLFHKIAAADLKVQAVMSFHAAGENVGDNCNIPLPKWVLNVGEANPDMFYTDRQGFRNKECISLGADHEPLLWGRTPVQCYRDFFEQFCDNFQYLFGSWITEVTVGLGPAGELRYPSYPERDQRWRFPGVGEFQCYDAYMLADLRQQALQAGHPEWGLGGPHDAGNYNSSAWETPFFASHNGSWDTEYGRFFLKWYSSALLRHADDILSECYEVLNAPGRPQRLHRMTRTDSGSSLYEFRPAAELGCKLAGVHWWFSSRSHAAELTAGYYNTREINGYAPIFKIMKKYEVSVSFTCVEMRDSDHPTESRCSPQGLLRQVFETAEQHGVPLAGENALQRYDGEALDQLVQTARGVETERYQLHKITFLRMGDMMFDHWTSFWQFMHRMREVAAPKQEDVEEPVIFVAA